MAKVYKIQRELFRLLNQPRQWPNDFFTYFFGPMYYDWCLSWRRIQRRGEQTASERVAVYVIFPVDGLKESHLMTLRHLSDKRYTVVLVSNLPLADEEIDMIIPFCGLYIERPNFGYDFGAYRDGILAAMDGEVKVKQLILLNDSVWFPVTDQTDWLDDIQRLDVDFAAAASNFDLPRPDPEDFRSFVFEYRAGRPKFYYCSFAMAIGKRPLSDKNFKKFWQKYPLTNKKKSTVRRGEVGLTAWMLKGGYSHGSTFDVASMERSLNALEAETLEKVIQHLIVLGDERMKAVLEQALDNIDELSHADRVKLVLTVVARQGVTYASAYFNITQRGFPFLKKSPLWLDIKARNISLKIVDGLNTSEAAVIRKEAVETAPR